MKNFSQKQDSLPTHQVRQGHDRLGVVVYKLRTQHSALHTVLLTYFL